MRQGYTSLTSGGAQGTLFEVVNKDLEIPQLLNATGKADAWRLTARGAGKSCHARLTGS